MQLLLGSNSPRRNELLSQMGFDFKKVSIECEETFDNVAVADVAKYLAEKKSKAYTSLSDEDLLITADTVVIQGNNILNKPSSVEHAKQMLKMLSGTTHFVRTGVCLRTLDLTIVFDSLTEVIMDELTDEEIEFYIQKYNPFDKAGSYGIQEWLGLNKINSINGCFYNVVGLP
ncbi:MAG: septum formation protein Maf, partial [Bacteroidia bacterium]|nr:septum formation protein Maf [Bacteroidia bacterium]